MRLWESMKAEKQSQRRLKGSAQSNLSANELISAVRLLSRGFIVYKVEA